MRSMMSSLSDCCILRAWPKPADHVCTGRSHTLHVRRRAANGSNLSWGGGQGTRPFAGRVRALGCRTFHGTGNFSASSRVIAESAEAHLLTFCGWRYALPIARCGPMRSAEPVTLRHPSRLELAADGVVHVLGIACGSIGAASLLALIARRDDWLEF